MKKGYLRNVVNEGYFKRPPRPLPKLGQIVRKKHDEENDQRDYVVVGTERNELHDKIWIYPTGNIDHENTKAESVERETLE